MRFGTRSGPYPWGWSQHMNTLHWTFGHWTLDLFEHWTLNPLEHRTLGIMSTVNIESTLDMLFSSRISTLLLGVITRASALLLGVITRTLGLIFGVIKRTSNLPVGLARAYEYFTLDFELFWILDLVDSEHFESLNSKYWTFKHYEPCGFWTLWISNSEYFEIIEHWIPEN